MSLLMDALRKAEEAKKKAEKADLGQAEQEQEQIEQSAAIDTETPLTTDSEQQRDAEPVVTPENEPEPPTLIPNVQIEFQQTETEASQQQSSTVDEEADSGTASPASELSLEPIDPGLSQLTRQPFDQAVTPDYSLETSGTSLGLESGSDYSSPSPAQASDSSVKKDEEQAVEQELIAQASADDVSSSSEQARDDSAAGYAGSAVAEASPRQQEEPLAPTGKRSSARVSRPDAATSRSKTAPNPNLRANPEGSSVVARSAADRRSARAIFAAKKQGGGRRFRIRRSTRIWAAQIAAVLIVLAGGAYLYLSISANSNSFNVPEEYLVNQDTYSSEFNEELEAVDEAAIAPEPSLDELAAVAEELLPEDIEFDDFPLPQQISGVVENDTEVVAAAPADNATALDTNVIDTGDMAVQAEPEPAVTEVPAPATPADTARETLPVPPSALASNDFQPSRQASAPISFSRAQPVNVIDPLLQDAYVAYQRDDLAQAQELYQQVLSESPVQRDALLGLAAIATRNGETSLAMELYSRLLARDPSDGVARAGLLGLRPVGGPETQERELRRLLEDHPQVAPVVYALGNFYAGQNRWNEAQRYYFNALQLAKADALAGIPVNPDYAFNLAVSLERLRQPTAAENYYREAIAFATDFPAGFDISIARNRLSRLTGRDS